jgi:ribosome biogenesis GTPase
MKIYTKETLGWNPFLAQQINTTHHDFELARVSAENKNNYLLLLPAHGEVTAECTGKILFNAVHKSDLPKIGDWVMVQYFADEAKALIHGILPRRNTLSRKAAGNVTEEQIIATHVDKVLIVQGLDHNFNLNRLVRTVVLVREAGITPIIILNKADIATALPDKINTIKAHLKQVQIFALSALNNKGIEVLTDIIKTGETIVLMGSSGVGKSTLVNRLTGNISASTSSVREKDAKGRHTTTRREMYILPQGGILIDTPGTRELQLMSAKEGLNDTFDQVTELATQCRFADCSHETEAGCAVLAALDSEEISEIDYRNFMKLKREDAYMQAKTDQKAFLDKKAKDKQLHKHIRAIYKKRKF